MKNLSFAVVSLFGFGVSASKVRRGKSACRTCKPQIEVLEERWLLSGWWGEEVLPPGWDPSGDKRLTALDVLLLVYQLNKTDKPITVAAMPPQGLEPVATATFQPAETNGKSVPGSATFEFGVVAVNNTSNGSVEISGINLGFAVGSVHDVYATFGGSPISAEFAPHADGSVQIGFEPVNIASSASPLSVGIVVELEPGYSGAFPIAVQSVATSSGRTVGISDGNANFVIDTFQVKPFAVALDNVGFAANGADSVVGQVELEVAPRYMVNGDGQIVDKNGWYFVESNVESMTLDVTGNVDLATLYLRPEDGGTSGTVTVIDDDTVRVDFDSSNCLWSSEMNEVRVDGSGPVTVEMTNLTLKPYNDTPKGIPFPDGTMPSVAVVRKAIPDRADLIFAGTLPFDFQPEYVGGVSAGASITMYKFQLLNRSEQVQTLTGLWGNVSNPSAVSSINFYFQDKFQSVMANAGSTNVWGGQWFITAAGVEVPPGMVLYGVLSADLSMEAAGNVQITLEGGFSDTTNVDFLFSGENGSNVIPVTGVQGGIVDLTPLNVTNTVEVGTSSVIASMGVDIRGQDHEVEQFDFQVFCGMDARDFTDFQIVIDGTQVAADFYYLDLGPQIIEAGFFNQRSRPSLEVGHHTVELIGRPLEAGPFTIVPIASTKLIGSVTGNLGSYDGEIGSRINILPIAPTTIVQPSVWVGYGPEKPSGWERVVMIDSALPPSEVVFDQYQVHNTTTTEQPLGTASFATLENQLYDTIVLRTPTGELLGSADVVGNETVVNMTGTIPAGGSVVFNANVISKQFAEGQEAGIDLVRMTLASTQQVSNGPLEGMTILNLDPNVGGKATIDLTSVYSGAVRSRLNGYAYRTHTQTLIDPAAAEGEDDLLGDLLPLGDWSAAVDEAILDLV
jgi:hypothetical protein